MVINSSVEIRGHWGTRKTNFSHVVRYNFGLFGVANFFVVVNARANFLTSGEGESGGPGLNPPVGGGHRAGGLAMGFGLEAQEDSW